MAIAEGLNRGQMPNIDKNKLRTSIDKLWSLLLSRLKLKKLHRKKSSWKLKEIEFKKD